MTREYTGFLKYLYDWQTLIAGVIALIAAYVASRPVWRQLKLSARDTLIGRVAALELRQETTRQLMTSITGAFMSQLRLYDEDRELDPDPLWASAAQNTVGQVITTLTANQETSLDGGLIDKKRKAALFACNALSDCLSDIHAPYSVDFGGPDAPAETERQTFEERGYRAVRQLESRISAATKAANDLDAAFLARLNELRRSIRRTDGQVGA